MKIAILAAALLSLAALSFGGKWTWQNFLNCSTVIVKVFIKIF